GGVAMTRGSMLLVANLPRVPLGLVAQVVRSAGFYPSGARLIRIESALLKDHPMPKVQRKPHASSPSSIVRDATPFEIAVMEFLREWECFKNADRNESTEEEIGDDVRDLDAWANRVEWEFRLQQINGPTVRVEMPPS